jgi:hypothetical protein
VRTIAGSAFRLDSEVGLHLRQVPLEGGVVFSKYIVVDHHDWGSVFASERLKLFGRHVGLSLNRCWALSRLTHWHKPKD